MLPAQFIKPCLYDALKQSASEQAIPISRNRQSKFKSARSLEAKEAMRESIKRATAAQAIMDALRDSTDSDNDGQVSGRSD